MSAHNRTLNIQILEAIEANKLPIPSQPDIVMKLQEVVNDPDVNVNDLYQIIKTDPGLTARILRLANSPMVRGKVPIQDLSNAISRMGVSFVGNLAVGLAMEQMFNTKNKAIADRINHAWRHSALVACICTVLVKQHPHIPVDQAMLAGILHEIGILSILSFAEKEPELLQDEVQLDKLIEENAPKLSQGIMKAWQFSPELSSIPVKLYDCFEEKEQVDLADTLLVAKLLALADKPHPLNKLNRAELPCFKRLGLDPNKTLEDNEDLKTAVDASMEVFK